MSSGRIDADGCGRVREPARDRRVVGLDHVLQDGEVVCSQLRAIDFQPPSVEVPQYQVKLVHLLSHLRTASTSSRHQASAWSSKQIFVCLYTILLLFVLYSML